MATTEVAEVMSAFPGIAEANVYGVRRPLVPSVLCRSSWASVVAAAVFDVADARYKSRTRTVVLAWPHSR